MWHVEDVTDVILIFFECNAIYVRDVILIFFECNAIYVEDVEDRSNTPKSCNAMYVKDVKDVEDGKGTYSSFQETFFT